MEKLISIIIPIYKVEPYLHKCVDSILNQTYTNLEVILVDDGSPDNCGAICDEYAAKDARVKVIHKPNGGLSDARNAGMAVMQGEYVIFVDSDDYVDTNWCEVLLKNICVYDADMSISGIIEEVVKNGITERTVVTPEYGNAPFCESNVDMMRRYFETAWAAWDKLYRAELFDGITYPVGEINEDEAIVLHLLDRCKRVCYTNEVFYHYVRRVDGSSITTSSFSTKKLAWVKHCRDNLEFIRQKYPQLELLAAARYRGSILWALREMALSSGVFDKEREQLKKELKENRKLFRAAPFKSNGEQLRYYMTAYLPLGAYQAILRMRHM